LNPTTTFIKYLKSFDVFEPMVSVNKWELNIEAGNRRYKSD